MAKKKNILLVLSKAELVLTSIILLLIAALVFTVVTFSRKVNVQTITKSVDTVQKLMKQIDTQTVTTLKNDINTISSVINSIPVKELKEDIKKISSAINLIPLDKLKKLLTSDDLENSVARISQILNNLCNKGYTFEAGAFHSKLPQVPEKPLTIKFPCGK